MALFQRRSTDPATLDGWLRQAAADVSAGRVKQGRAGYRRVLDSVADPPVPTPVGDRFRAVALVGLGDLARLHDGPAARGEAIRLYRDAATIMPPPPYVLDLLALDVARRRDATPPGCDILVAWFAAGIPQLGGSTAAEITAFTREVCLVAADADRTALTVAERLALRIAGAVPDLAWAHYARGCAALRLGDATAAVESLTAAERLAPTEAGAPIHLGHALHLLGDDARALVAFRRALALESGSAELHLQVGRMLALSDAAPPTDLDEAAERFTQACRLDPRRADAWHQLGTVLRRRGRLAAAVTPLRTATERAPGNASWQADLVDLLVELDDWSGAIDALRVALTWTPAAAGLHARLGATLVRVGRHGEARTALDEALRLDPAQRLARSALGRSLSEQGRFAEAAWELGQLRDHLPAERHLLVRAWAQEGAGDRAIAELNRMAGGDGGLDRPSAILLGCLQARRAAWPEAVAAFDRAASEAAGNDQPAGGAVGPAELALWRGIALHRSGDLVRARIDLEEAIAGHPDDARAHAARGALALDLGEHEQARASFERAVALDPDDARARIGVAIVREIDGSPDAGEAYAHGIAARPDWWPARVRAGRIAIAGGRLTQAVELLSGPTEASAPPGETRFLLALAHAMAGDLTSARTLWSAADDDPDGMRAHNIAVCDDLIAHQALDDGDHSSAAVAWESCAARWPQDPRYRTAAAEACLRAAVECLDGARADARTFLGRSIALDPADGRAPYLLRLLALAQDSGAVAPEVSAAEEPAVTDGAYHRALGLLAAGRLDDAATVLDGIAEAASDLGPAFGLLRGTVAARQGNWSGGFTSFAAALAETAALDCRNGQHRLDSTHRAASALARCARPAERIPGAIRILMPLGAGCASVSRLVGLLQVQAGQHDAAIATLTPLDGTGVGGDVVAAAHRGRAAGHLTAGRFGEAMADVEAADAAEGRAHETAATRSAIARWRIDKLLRSGHLRAAFGLVDEHLLRDPADPVAVHQQAVITHRMVARDATTGADGAVVDALLASLAAVLVGPASWSELAASTGRVSSEEDRAAVRRTMAERIVVVVRDLGDVGGARPALDVAWGLELSAAEVMAQVAPERDVEGWPAGFACGPIMLRRIARTPVGQALAQRLRAAVAQRPLDGAPRLQMLLSSLGPGLHLLDAGRPDAAEAALASLPPSNELVALRARVARAQAVDRAGSGNWAGALTCFSRAAELGADVADHRATIREAALKRVRQILTADDEDHAGALAALRSVRGLMGGDPEFDEHIGATLGQLGRQANNEDDYPRAVDLLRTAVEHAPHDRTVRRFLRTALGNLATALLDNGQDAALPAAIALLKEALTYDVDASIQRLLASCLFRTKQYAEAADLLEDVLRSDPSDEELAQSWGVTVSRLAMSLAERGRRSEALDVLTRALSIHDQEQVRMTAARLVQAR